MAKKKQNRSVSLKSGRRGRRRTSTGESTNQSKGKHSPATARENELPLAVIIADRSDAADLGKRIDALRALIDDVEQKGAHHELPAMQRRMVARLLEKELLGEWKEFLGPEKTERAMEVLEQILRDDPGVFPIGSPHYYDPLYAAASGSNDEKRQLVELLGQYERNANRIGQALQRAWESFRAARRDYGLARRFTDYPGVLVDREACSVLVQKTATAKPTVERFQKRNRGGKMVSLRFEMIAQLAGADTAGVPSEAVEGNAKSLKKNLPPILKPLVIFDKSDKRYKLQAGDIKRGSVRDYTGNATGAGT